MEKYFIKTKVYCSWDVMTGMKYKSPFPPSGFLNLGLSLPWLKSQIAIIKLGTEGSHGTCLNMLKTNFEPGQSGNLEMSSVALK